MSMMTKRVLTRNDPAGDLGDILTGSGYLAWLDARIKEHLRRADIYEEAGTIVENGIRKAGKRWLMGADTYFTARRCTRPLKHAAGLEYEGAKALSLARALYRGAFADATTERASAGEFDPTQ